MIFTAIWHLTGLLSLLSFFYIVKKLKTLLQGRSFKNIFFCLVCGFLGGLAGVVLFISYSMFTPDIIDSHSDVLMALMHMARCFALYICAFFSAFLLGFLLRKLWPVMAIAWSGCLASAFIVFHPHLFHWLGRLQNALLA